MEQAVKDKLNLPKISIITPSYNQAQYIEQTIKSVLNQQYPNLEYIIIDGGSKDGTAEIIKKYEHFLTYWVSEKDNGQAHAINKGLLHCTGDIFNWINSDDFLEEGALHKVASAFKKTDIGMVGGAVQDFAEDGFKTLHINKLLSIEDMLNPIEAYLYHQPGVWLRIDVMKKTGNFREDYHYCFDQQYMLRYLQQIQEVHYIPDILAYFRLHKQSKTVSQKELFLQDFKRMYKEFWQTNAGTPLGEMAKRKSLAYEWPLIQHSLNDGTRGRLSTFIIALKELGKNPVQRINKKSLGWLKHILFGTRRV
ncbi:MAG: glycosyltransferase [Flavobacterium sp.]|nr:MAG: glycosyltransferase [Flavobacterium sp.]